VSMSAHITSAAIFVNLDIVMPPLIFLYFVTNNIIPYCGAIVKGICEKACAFYGFLVSNIA